MVTIDAVNEVWRPDQGQRVIINLPATVEVSTPNVFADQVELVHENIRYREHVLISVHTHDDRGCGVAAAELAVMAGADRVEGTLLGNGERTGNMDLVTAGMNLYAQGIDPEIDFSRMKEIRALVEEITEIDTHPLDTESRRVGRVEGNTSSASRISSCASPLWRARSSSVGRDPMLWVPNTTSTHGARSRTTTLSF